MIRIRSATYPDGKTYTEVHLPPLSDPQLYSLECVVDAIWSVVDYSRQIAPLDIEKPQGGHPGVGGSVSSSQKGVSDGNRSKKQPITKHPARDP
jgi:hypothetical protein